MPTRVLYQIPLATWPYHLIMGSACLIVLVMICVWWLPKLIRRVRHQFGESWGQAAVGTVVAMVPTAIGFGLLFLLIALIRNPQAYVTDTGVTKESVFHQTPVSFTWQEISRVYCRSESVGAISSIVVVANDGRRIELGNTGGVDFASMYELFENQLGPMVVRHCDGVPELSR